MFEKSSGLKVLRTNFILAKPMALCTHVEIFNWRVKMGGFGITTMALVVGVPLLLVVIGVVVLLASRGSKK